ncbi:MAG: tryptophan synthase subunit alpha [Sphingomonas bacterium]|nr:tryptophan synthase subunit alpha [Sphingomonas bacterium]
MDHSQLFAALCNVGAPPPVLGFGISSPEQVRQSLASGAAGVISGSAIVAKVGDGPSAVRDFVSSMKAATAR